MFANSSSLLFALSFPLDASSQPILTTFRLISSISTGSSGSGVGLFVRGGGEGGLVAFIAEGGGDSGWMMSEIDSDGDGAAIVDVGGSSWFDAARVSQRKHVIT